MIFGVRADVAQLVEQRFCKPLVGGSTPLVGLYLVVRVGTQVAKGDRL